MFVWFSPSAVQPSHAAGDDFPSGLRFSGRRKGGRILPANRHAVLDLYVHANFSLLLLSPPTPCQSGTRTLERTCISMPSGPIHLCRLVLYGVNGGVDQVKRGKPIGTLSIDRWEGGGEKKKSWSNSRRKKTRSSCEFSTG